MITRFTLERYDKLLRNLEALLNFDDDENFSAAGELRSGYFFKPGKKAKRPAGESIKARTLLKYMQATYRAVTGNTKAPVHFAPTDVGYIPHVLDQFGNATIPGGWRRQEMLDAVQSKKKYVGTRPIHIQEQNAFGLRHVEESEAKCVEHAQKVLSSIKSSLRPVRFNKQTNKFE